MQNQIESASHGIMYNHCSTITIETRLGFKLTGTPNHLVIANRHGKMYMSTVRSDKAEREFYDGRVWKNLEHLSSDDYICIPYGYNVFSNEYIQLNSKPLKVANQGKQDIVIPSILNEELAEFMGIYYADGTWDDSNGSFTIRIHNSHSEVIERVKYLAKKLFNIEAGYDKTPSINITGKALRPIVELLNLQKGCTNKQISELILKSPRNVVIAYIKGMTLDGHAEVRDKEKRTLFNLTVSNELSARYMQSILLNLGIVASLEYALPSDPNTYSLEVTNEQYALFRDLIGFEQSKDYIYAQNWGKPNNKYRNDRNNKVIWVNIKKITHGVDNVYDLHVPQTHSFISNGMISHNTGRFSSSDPNLQNIPSHNKEIRKMFVADPGNVLVGGDFSQQEPRLLAHMSGDEHMIEAYLDGKDIYATIAAKVYHLPYEQCLEFNPDGSKNPEGKKRRQNTKSIVLGIMYGRGANSIAEQTGMSKEEAQAVIDGFFSAFPKIKNFVEGSVNHAKQYGYVDTVYGRKRRLPDIQLPEVELSTFDGSPVNQSQVNGILFMYKNANSKKKRDEVKNKLFSQGIRIKDNGGFIAQAERQCVNSRIQGGGADISKKAMVLLGTNEELKNLGYKILLTVHDEVIGMCPKENAKKCAELMKSIMIASCKDKVSVPMKVDTEITYCWYGEEIELN
jgi:intein/homing endonuclease